MHELSIAYSLVRMAQEAAQQAGAERVTVVRLEVGAMAGIVPEALTFSFDIAAQGTLLEGAHLDMTHVPVVVYCAPCGQEVEPVGPASVRCPVCQTPSALIRRGQELDLVSLEIEEAVPTTENTR